MKKFTFTVEVCEEWYLEVEAKNLEEAERIAKEADGADWHNPNNDSDKIWGGSWNILWDATTVEEVA